MIARVEAALRLRKKLAASVILSVFSVAWLVVLIPQAGAVGIFTARGNNKLYGALVVGGGLDSNAESFKATTMAAAEGNPVSVASSSATGAVSGNAATASSSVATGSLIPIGQVKYVIKTAIPTGASSSGDGGNGSITYSDASILALGTDFAGLAALSTIATASGQRFSFGGGPTTSSTVCAAIGTVADGVLLSPTQSITFVFQVASTNALAMGAAGFNFSSDATATCSAGGLTRADSVNQTETGIPTTTTTTTTTTSTTTTTVPKVPTVGNWGMMILGLAFLDAMAWMLKARKVHLQ
jgi:hypothetical protein